VGFSRMNLCPWHTRPKCPVRACCARGQDAPARTSGHELSAPPVLVLAVRLLWACALFHWASSALGGAGERVSQGVGAWTCARALELQDGHHFLQQWQHIPLGYGRAGMTLSEHTQSPTSASSLWLIQALLAACSRAVDGVHTWWLGA
jgi:hypothetical protein